MLGPGHGELEFSDDGKGLPDEDLKRPEGTGMQLITLLVTQAEAEAAWASDNGTKLTLTFKCEPSQPRVPGPSL